MSSLTVESTSETRRVRWYTLLALVFVPLLLVGVVLFAVHDYNSRLSGVTAAVVNNDDGTTIDGQAVPLGRQLTAGLVKGSDDATGITGNYDWVLTDDSDAAAGLADGRYAVVVTIPADFSVEATSFSDAATAEQAIIDVQTSDTGRIADGAISTAITSTAARVFGEELSRSYLDNVYLGFNTLHDQLGTAADGAQKLGSGARQSASGAGQLATGAQDLADGTSELADGIGQLSTGTRSSADGAQKLAAGTSEFAAGIGELSTGTRSSATGAQELATGTSALADGLGALSAGTDQVADGAQQLADGTTELTGGIRLYVDGAGTLASGLEEFSAGVAQLPDQVGLLATGAYGVADGVDAIAQLAVSQPDLTLAQLDAIFVSQGTSLQALSAGASGIAAGTQQFADGLSAEPDGLVAAVASAAAGAREFATKGEEVVAGAQELADGASDLASGLDTLANGTAESATGAQKLAVGTSDLAGGLTTLADGTAKSATGAQDLASGTGDLAGGLDKLADGTAESAAGTRKLAVGTGDLASGISEFATGSTKLADGTSELADGLDEAVEALPTYSATDRSRLADVVTVPVATDTVSVSSMVSRSGIPLLISLALWFGALAVYFVVQAASRRALTSRKSSIALAVAGYLPGLGVGVVQGIAVAALAQISLQLQVGDWFALAGTAAIIGAAFAAIVQGVVAVLGNGGRLLVAIAGVVALSGGLISTAPTLVLGLADVIPTAAASSAIGAIITGSGSPGGSIMVLVLWGVIGFALSTLAVVRRRSVSVPQLGTLRLG